MALLKKDFEYLHWIEFMNYNNAKLLSVQMNVSVKGAEHTLLALQKRGLITIEFREDIIYGSQLTEKGKNLWNNKKYASWKEELGY